MAKLRWKSNSCTDRALGLIEVALKKVEEEVSAAGDENAKNGSAPRDQQKQHIPTMINDLLYPSCIAVAVSPNVGEGACFRGMQCAQYSVAGKVYNIAVIMKPEDLAPGGGRLNDVTGGGDAGGGADEEKRHY
ncbi:hypothetical protein CSUI_005418 [Cystoisospora suis]|uniref:Uncharacterized protein n=1 Tax=Cystoisospora suis TaxID=483139 RepID=A0A2C6KXK1_9APIC|nr:hypothetical protein CSUI_005418 [Cystoisospora suis]